jgi:hypothetical protein
MLNTDKIYGRSDFHEEGMSLERIKAIQMESDVYSTRSNNDWRITPENFRRLME